VAVTCLFQLNVTVKVCYLLTQLVTISEVSLIHDAGRTPQESDMLLERDRQTEAQKGLPARAVGYT